MAAETLGETLEGLASKAAPEHRDLLKAAAREPDETRLRETLTGEVVWGGTGSVLDHSPEDDPEGYDRLILALAQALEDLGWDTPRTRQAGLLLEDYFNRPGGSDRRPGSSPA